MTEKRITVRSKPLVFVNGDDQGTEVVDVAICTKIGMDVMVRGGDIVTPNSDCYFYIKLEHPWKRADGSDDYNEVITNGDDFYMAFQTLGKQRLKWTETVQDVVLSAIQKFVKELNQ